MSNNKKSGKIQVEQIKSCSGATQKIIGTLKGLGLGKIGKVKTLENTDAVQGMIHKVKHLVKYSEV